MKIKLETFDYFCKELEHRINTDTTLEKHNKIYLQYTNRANRKVKFRFTQLNIKK